MGKKRYKVILIITVVVILSLGVNAVKAASEAEGITLTTYYPSPEGKYDTMDIRIKATMDKLTLLENAELKIEGVADPIIDALGDIKIDGVDFNGDKFYTSNLMARKLYVKRLGDMTRWKVSPQYSYDESAGAKPVDCGEGMVNRVLNLSYLSPLPLPGASVSNFFGCLTIPLGDGIQLILCAGQESFRMDYFCIEEE